MSLRHCLHPLFEMLNIPPAVGILSLPDGGIARVHLARGTEESAFQDASGHLHIVDEPSLSSSPLTPHAKCFDNNMQLRLAFYRSRCKNDLLANQKHSPKSSQNMVTWCFPLTPHLALTSEEMVASFSRQAKVCLERLARYFLCQAAPQPLFQWPALPQPETQGPARVFCECGWPAWVWSACLSGAWGGFALACLLFSLLPCLAQWLTVTGPLSLGWESLSCMHLYSWGGLSFLLIIPVFVLWFFSTVAKLSMVTRFSLKKKKQLHSRSKKILV